MIGVEFFQSFLDAIGAVLAWLYDLIPNYGVAIILLTLGIRVLLLPLAMKQIRSMQAMQRVGPMQKDIQRKYKGDRQRIQEETMKLYKQEGVNPFGGCLPLLLQFPVLITLFYVLQFPKGMTHIPHSEPNPVVGQPQDSRLYVDIVNQHTNFLGMNLLCSAAQAGKQQTIPPKLIEEVPDLRQGDKYPKLDCGTSAGVRIPFYLALAAMIATTYYQQKQMQRASPTQNQQQQMLTRIMPIFFGFIGFNFPAGLVVYWTTTNAVQIVQQHFMLPKPEPVVAGKGGGDGKATPRERRSIMSWFTGLTGGQAAGSLPSGGKSTSKGSSGGGQPRGSKAPDGGSSGAGAKASGQKDTSAPSSGQGGGGNRAKRGSGGRNAGDRKKRRKR